MRDNTLLEAREKRLKELIVDLKAQLGDDAWRDARYQSLQRELWDLQELLARAD